MDPNYTGKGWRNRTGTKTQNTQKAQEVLYRNQCYGDRRNRLFKVDPEPKIKSSFSSTQSAVFQKFGWKNRPVPGGFLWGLEQIWQKYSKYTLKSRRRLIQREVPNKHQLRNNCKNTKGKHKSRVTPTRNVRMELRRAISLNWTQPIIGNFSIT